MNEKHYRINEIHLEVLQKIAAGRQIILGQQSNMFRFNRGRSFYNVNLLSELRQEGYLTEDNQVTTNGTLWLLVNS